MNSQRPFQYLHSKLREWKANDLLVPPLQLSWERFQELATTQILPVLHEAREILESEGLEVSITDLDEDTRSLGFYVKNVGLFFSAGDDALTLRFMARRFTGEEQGYEARALYRNVTSERIRKVVEEALLRLLGPRRANAVNQ
ncbi:MAG: hypothetical protein UZ03_NOB001000312 [Nitrospira sp. OLB3]|nr:MAG: hypothetical protein UZ03_NOB001000312 [Nitrospira sp. OLB3]